MNDNTPPSNAGHYRSLADDAYAASERLSGNSQRIMRQIAASYHRLAVLADEEDCSAPASAPLMGCTEPEAGVA